MNYYLAKTDPDTYSIADFALEKETLWDGVHNNQAIQVIRTMQPGDRVYIYHSQSDKAIVGIAEVSGEPFLNTEDERHSWAVRMRFVRQITPITLAQFKAEPTCADFLLVRNPRLSTMPVPPTAVQFIESLIS